jgi:hypothetical protein
MYRGGNKEQGDNNLVKIFFGIICIYVQTWYKAQRILVAWFIETTSYVLMYNLD